MQTHYALCLSLVIYLSFLAVNVDLDDPQKSKEKVKEPLEEFSKEKENVAYSKQNVVNQKTPQNMHKEEIVKDKLKENVLKNEKDDSPKNKDAEVLYSSQPYEPTHINKDSTKEKSLSSDEYVEVLKKIYLEELKKEFLNNDNNLNKVKENAIKALKESEEFPGTAEETVLFEEMLEQEYEEYLLKVSDIILGDSQTEVQGSQSQSQDINPNPSFSDLNSKEILHTSLPDTLKPPDASKSSKTDKLKTEENGEKKPKKEPELTEEEKQAKVLYETAVMILNSTKPDKKRAYDLFKQAAELNHVEAGKVVGQAYFFGDVFPQNLTAARYWFEKLSKEKGSPFAQMHLGLMHAAGLGVPASLAKAVVYYTFSALGGDTWSQMIMGYRHWAGLGLVPNCESALTYYRKVAKKVEEELSTNGGFLIQRTRLYDEVENLGSAAGVLDDDLIQYYQFLADKGDVQAQVCNIKTI